MNKTFSEEELKMQIAENFKIIEQCIQDLRDINHKNNLEKAKV